jgi:hypothetical protein
MIHMLHSAYGLQEESMEYSEFQLVMEEAQQWVKQKQNDSLPPNEYDPKIKDFLENTWDRLNDFALPHGDNDQLPEKIQKILLCTVRSTVYNIETVTRYMDTILSTIVGRTVIIVLVRNNLAPQAVFSFLFDRYLALLISGEGSTGKFQYGTGNC